MEKNDAADSQKATSSDLISSAAKAKTRNQKSKSSAPAEKSSPKWEYKEHWRRASNLKRAKWIGGGIAAFATICGGLIFPLFNILQTKWNFEKENRSVISTKWIDMLNRPSAGQPVNFQIHLSNTGKMDAQNAFEQVEGFVGKDLTLSAPKTPDRIESGATFAHDIPIQINVSTKPLSQAEADMVNQGKLCVYAVGYISYWDDFGGKQSVFCGMYKANQTWNPQLPGIALCPHNNRVLWDGRETESHTTKCE